MRAKNESITLIVGYYGYRNWGDEASLAVLVEGLQGLRVAALSGDPPFTHQTYGIEAVPRTAWRQVRQAIRRSDALILGGGSLLQDATSLRSLLYYLLLIRWGLQAHGRVLLVGQGMGPFHRAISRYLVRQTLNRVPFLSVRDEQSAALLRQIGVHTPIRIDADLTWTLQAHPAHFALPTGKPCVGLAPRPWRTLPVHEVFIALCRRQIEAGWLPVLIPMQETQDRPLCEAIADAVQVQGAMRPPIAPPPEHPAQLLGLMSQLKAMVSMRLHVAIFAAGQGVPLLCLAYDPKVNALAQQIGAPTIPLEGDWQAVLSRPWGGLKEQLTPPDAERIDALRQKAQALLDEVRRFLGE
ncbi:MAG: polysaccharide pyruvyl transferase CsaB [Fimbriimonadales bacterium]|nr:polysaccharide pyruvyl transferase CsaB [Fimbriimonadales bacterium]